MPEYFKMEGLVNMALFGGTAALTWMWLLYIVLGVFPLIYVTVKGGKKE
jgi:hypothetical protein